VARRNPEATFPTGEGMKPLKRGRARQQCLVRTKRVGSVIDPGETAFGLSDELVLVTANFGETLSSVG
jgi:hypothetical protein